MFLIIWGVIGLIGFLISAIVFVNYSSGWSKDKDKSEIAAICGLSFLVWPLALPVFFVLLTVWMVLYVLIERGIINIPKWWEW